MATTAAAAAVVGAAISAVTAPPERTQRVLCLHGKGTNREVFAMQTSAQGHRALRDALGTRYTFDFIQAPLPTDPYPGIELFHEGPYFSWYDESITSKELAIASVLAYIKAHSVTAVMGFSQGCALAAALVAFHPLAVEWALFIGGGWPLGEWQLKTKPAIMIPAVHVVGLYDVVRSRSLELLSHHAPGSTGLLYEHPGAHVVPRKPDEVSEIVKLVHTVANRACANRSYEEAARTDGNAKS